LGDAASQPGSKLVYDALTAEVTKKNSNRFNAVLFAGDLAYAEGESAQWQAFLHNIQGVVQRVPAMYIPGNRKCIAGCTSLNMWVLGCLATRAEALLALLLGLVGSNTPSSQAKAISC
jgi:hypothetical protein